MPEQYIRFLLSKCENYTMSNNIKKIFLKRSYKRFVRKMIHNTSKYNLLGILVLLYKVSNKTTTDPDKICINLSGTMPVNITKLYFDNDYTLKVTVKPKIKSIFVVNKRTMDEEKILNDVFEDNINKNITSLSMELLEGGK